MISYLTLVILTQYKNCLFSAVKLTRNAYKKKLIHNGYGIKFHNTCQFSFGVGNSSSKHSAENIISS